MELIIDDQLTLIGTATFCIEGKVMDFRTVVSKTNNGEKTFWSLDVAPFKNERLVYSIVLFKEEKALKSVHGRPVVVKGYVNISNFKLSLVGRRIWLFENQPPFSVHLAHINYDEVLHPSIRSSEGLC